MHDDLAKLIIFTLSSPFCRPTLDQMAAHPFFTHDAAMMPDTVPLSGTHIAPDWQEDANGKIYAVEKASDEKYRRPTIMSRRKKSTTATTESSASELKASSSGRPALVPKSANTATASAKTGGGGGGGATSGSKKQSAPAPPSSSSSKFNIFEEDKEPERKSSGHHENPPQSDLFSNGQATGGAAATVTTPTLVSNTASSSPTSSTADKDMHALEVMHRRLQNAFESAGAVSSQRSKSTPATSDVVQPDRWVTRYVDYTSKYGLGFLLNDGRYVHRQ